MIEILALLQSRGPIIQLSKWVHDSMTQAGEDVSPVIVIGLAAAGMLKGWLGMLAGFLLGLIVVAVIQNADNITAWAKHFFLG